MNALRPSLAPAVRLSIRSTCLRRWAGGNPRSRDGRAFSLIEVVIAIAVFSVSVLAIVGLMASGLTSARASSQSVAISNIERLLRANLDGTDYGNIATLAVTTNYFTVAGYPTSKSPASVIDTPYYSLSITAQNPQSSLVTGTHADVISATLLYPYPVNSTTNTFSLLVAQ